MWNRFAEPARKSVFYAQEEAGRLKDRYVSTEHLLLGILRERDNGACRVLFAMGVDPAMIDAAVRQTVVTGDHVTSADMALTPRGKRSIDFAYDETQALNATMLDTEHLLLGLMRVTDGLAFLVLNEQGITLDGARQIVANGVDIGAVKVWPPAVTGAEQPPTPTFSYNAIWGARKDARLNLGLASVFVGITLALMAQDCLSHPTIWASGGAQMNPYSSFPIPILSGFALAQALKARRLDISHRCGQREAIIAALFLCLWGAGILFLI